MKIHLDQGRVKRGWKSKVRDNNRRAGSKPDSQEKPRTRGGKLPIPYPMSNIV